MSRRFVTIGRARETRDSLGINTRPDVVESTTTSGPRGTRTPEWTRRGDHAATLAPTVLDNNGDPCSRTGREALCTATNPVTLYAEPSWRVAEAPFKGTDIGRGATHLGSDCQPRGGLTYGRHSDDSRRCNRLRSGVSVRIRWGPLSVQSLHPPPGTPSSRHANGRPSHSCR
jgi:hypothetical protein